MSELAGMATVLGVVLTLLYGFMACSPARALAALRGLPRHIGAAWVLTAIALLWSAWLLLQTPLGMFDKYKPLVYVLAPVSFALIVTFVDELLAARALGGVLLLLPAPMLAAARWHPSPLRYVITVLAYIMAIKGILLVLSPYRFRLLLDRWVRGPDQCRTAGIAGLVVGLAVLGLGLFVY